MGVGRKLYPTLHCLHCSDPAFRQAVVCVCWGGGWGGGKKLYPTLHCQHRSNPALRQAVAFMNHFKHLINCVGDKSTDCVHKSVLEMKGKSKWV